MFQTDKNIQFLLDPRSSGEVPDWAVFESMVKHHRFYHVLNEVLERYPDDIPPVIKQRLETGYHSQLRKQLLLANELQYLAGKFSAANLDFISPKGTALALQLYGDIGKRLTRDIDLLIHDKDIDRFLDLLKGEGYQIIRSEESKPERYFRQVKKNYTLVNREKNIVTELHWSLFSNKRFYPHEERLKENPDAIRTGGRMIPTMNRENHFIYLILHGSLHEYFRLFWLRDIHEAVTRWDLDWDKIQSRALKEDTLHILHSSLLISSELFKTPKPIPGIGKDERSRKLAAHIIRVINRSSLPGWQNRLSRIGYFMGLKDDLPYKAECITGVVKRYFMR